MKSMRKEQPVIFKSQVIARASALLALTVSKQRENIKELASGTIGYAGLSPYGYVVRDERFYYEMIKNSRKISLLLDVLSSPDVAIKNLEKEEKRLMNDGKEHHDSSYWGVTYSVLTHLKQSERDRRSIFNLENEM